MKKALYEVVFKVTETCQNGNERTYKKHVYMPRFDETTGKHVSPEQQIARGIEALKAEHYYNIQYLRTNCAELTFG